MLSHGKAIKMNLCHIPIHGEDLEFWSLVVRAGQPITACVTGLLWASTLNSQTKIPEL